MFRSTTELGDVAGRKLLQVSSFSPLNNFWKQFQPVLAPPEVGVKNNSPSSSPSPAPSPSLSPSPTPSITAKPHLAPSPTSSSSSPSSLPSPAENPSGLENSRRSHHRALILSAAIGGPILLFILITGAIFFRSNKIAVVKPWATGLSGQLQRAFVTGNFLSIPSMNSISICRTKRFS